MARRRRWLLAGLAGIVVCAACGVPVAEGAADGAVMRAPLRCELTLPARVTSGDPIALTLRLSNPGAESIAFLGWGTPFEGMWTGPSIDVTHDGAPQPYLGPMIKRGAPSAEEYVVVPSGGAVTAALPLHEAYDLSQPGRYQIVPRFVLRDVARGGDARLPRRPDAMREEPLRCPERLLEITPRH